MAVLNTTPDSFSDGGLFVEPEVAVRHALDMVAAGAAVVDIGGESTRPGYTPAGVETQLERVLPVLAALRPRIDVPISIDTTRAAVADAALRAGADWINDTTAFGEDPELADVVVQHRCPVVLMHRFTPPRTPADLPRPGRALVELLAARLAERLRFATRAGVAPERILLDPGLGFGTLPADNVAIHAHFEVLRRLERPLVVGPSRKSFLGHLTGRDVHARTAATAASVAALALAGADIVRVHDVAEARDAVLVADAIRRAQEDP
jgi:dihydropteroate synthase